MKVIFGFILLFTFSRALAQRQIEAADLKQFHFYEDSLRSLDKKMMTNENELERKNANYALIKTLVTALKIPDSYHYPFDSLKNISIVTAPDNRFRIMAWHIMNNDGSYRFYGAIQMNKSNLQLYPLEDYTPLIINPEDTVTDNKKWLGAQYYKIIQPDANTPYYVLLGWKGNTILSTKKVIDVLSFVNGNPVFGANIFVGNEKTRDRVIFEYSHDASMMLKYIPESKLIVFDHLSPADPKKGNKPDSYGPDMTYAGYQFKQGHWVYTDNLNLRNLPSTKDEQYVDPKKVLTGNK